MLAWFVTQKYYTQWNFADTKKSVKFRKEFGILLFMSKFEWFLGNLPESKTFLKPLEKAAVFHENVVSKCSFTQQ